MKMKERNVLYPPVYNSESFTGALKKFLFFIWSLNNIFEERLVTLGHFDAAENLLMIIMYTLSINK